jgi:Rrf2 family protein
VRAFRLPVRADYAIRALSALATAERPVTCLHIAQAQDIPIAYLRVIMRDLLRADLVRSTRGRGGGYMLGRPAVDLSLATIVQSVGVSVGRMGGLGPPPGERPGSIAAHVRELWLVLNDAVQTVLSQVTLAHLLQGQLRAAVVLPTAIQHTE